MTFWGNGHPISGIDIIPSLSRSQSLHTYSRSPHDLFVVLSWRSSALCFHWRDLRLEVRGGKYLFRCWLENPSGDGTISCFAKSTCVIDCLFHVPRDVIHGKGLQLLLILIQKRLRQPSLLNGCSGQIADGSTFSYWKPRRDSWIVHRSYDGHFDSPHRFYYCVYNCTPSRSIFFLDLFYVGGVYCLNRYNQYSHFHWIEWRNKQLDFNSSSNIWWCAQCSECGLACKPSSNCTLIKGPKPRNWEANACSNQNPTGLNGL